ncbi:MAG: Trk system potassium transporter TrkA [Myxococcales bacterium]|nr:Trk system potassium transporter TrkA [Myxococcales bacterium]MDD9970831.1 Trk system potassium transporter TrkA [Myxococcales bacterium]
MNVVIAGEDVVGMSIAEELMVEHKVVYIAPEEVERLERLDVHAVYGSPTSPEVLKRASVDTADLFVACTNNDEQNIVACIAAQRLGAKRTTCMLTRPGFLSVTGDDMALAESLGIDSVVRPAEQLADEIIRIVTVPGALDVEEFAGGRIRLMRCAVEDGAPITAAPLSELKLPQQVNLVMLRRNDEMTVPRGATHVQAGDKVVAMGREHAVRRLLMHWLRDPAAGSEKRTAAVVGAGTVGFAVVRGLEDAGFRVKVLEVKKQRCEEIAGLLDSLVLHGDGADLDLLEQERIGDSSVLVAVADNDEKNLLVSLLAKQLGVRRTVTRAVHLANELMFEKVGVDVVRSAKGAAIRSVVRNVDPSTLEIRAELEHGDACVIELDLPKGFPTTRLSDLRPPTFARVGSVQRQRRLFVPSGGDVLRAGDRVLIFCTRADEQQTRQFFLDPQAFADESQQSK